MHQLCRIRHLKYLNSNREGGVKTPKLSDYMPSKSKTMKVTNEFYKYIYTIIFTCSTSKSPPVFIISWMNWRHNYATRGVFLSVRPAWRSGAVTYINGLSIQVSLCLD